MIPLLERIRYEGRNIDFSFGPADLEEAPVGPNGEK